MKLIDIMNGPAWVVWLVAAVFVLLSAVLISGHGSFLIAGYNTASKEEKEKYDEKKLCRIFGYGLAVIAVLLLMMAFLTRVLPAGFVYVFTGITFADAVIMIWLGNTIAKKKE